MRKLFILFSTIMLCICSSNLYPNSLDDLAPRSAKYFVNCARNGSIDNSADIGTYNPAGLALIDPGMYIDISGQEYFVFESQQVKVDSAGFNRRYDNEKYFPAPVVPAAHAAYNMGKTGIGNLAFYLGLDCPAGTGSFKWKDGNAGQVKSFYGIAAQSAGFLTPSSLNMNVQASSVFLGLNFAAAYSLMDDQVSFSIGGRYIYAQQKVEVKGKYSYVETDFDINSKYTAEADGISPIIGIDFKPAGNLNIGLRYDFETRLEYEYDVDKRSAIPGSSGGGIYDYVAGVIYDNLPADGAKYKRNLPQSLSFGAVYKFNNKISGSISNTTYFIKSADINIPDKYFNYSGNCAMIGGNYQLNDSLLLGASAGYMFIGLDDSFYESSETLNLVSNFYPTDRVIALTCGATYKIPGTNIDLTVALANLSFITQKGSIDDPSSGTGVKVDYKKDVVLVSYGLGYKI